MVEHPHFSRKPSRLDFAPIFYLVWKLCTTINGCL